MFYISRPVVTLFDRINRKRTWVWCRKAFADINSSIIISQYYLLLFSHLSTSGICIFRDSSDNRSNKVVVINFLFILNILPHYHAQFYNWCRQMNPFGRLWKESGKKEIVLYEPYSTFTVTWKYGHSRVVFLVSRQYLAPVRFE